MGSQGKENNVIVHLYEECPRCTFILDYEHNGRDREVKQKIGEMAINGSGIREPARVLSISTHTVMKELKKRCDPAAVSAAKERAPRKTVTNRKRQL